MKSDFILAVTQLAAERGLPREKVIAAVEAALVSAYKKDSYAAGHDITVRLNPATGEVKVYVLKVVTEKPQDPRKELSLREARKFKKDAQPQDVMELETDFPSTGRVAAQTAKQVVLQRLREAERELVYAEYANKVGDILPGRVERMEAQQLIVNLGRAEGVMPREEQVPTERYRIGQNLQCYLVEVGKSTKGPELILSRTHKNLVRRLFEREIPEIYNGVVEIKAISREPGSRCKVAVAARQEGVDPVGSCVGLRGLRIQTIVNELQGEKIDVVQWGKDPASLIANSVSPAQVLKVELNEKEKTATVVVPDKQISLAIGKEGQNARLAAKLTGWKIEIKSLTEYEGLQALRAAATAEVAAVAPVPAEAPAPAPEVVPTVVKGEVAAPPAEVPEAAPSQEQEPALTEEALPKKEEQPAPAPLEISEEVWVVPKVVKEPAVLRFAEDIIPGRAPKDKKGKVGEEEGIKPKKARRIRVTPDAEEEEGF